MAASPLQACCRPARPIPLTEPTSNGPPGARRRPLAADPLIASQEIAINRIQHIRHLAGGSPPNLFASPCQPGTCRMRACRGEDYERR
jgi:hypothetical protein